MKYNVKFEQDVKTYYTVTVDCDSQEDLDVALDSLEYSNNIEEAVGKMAMSQGVTVLDCHEDMVESEDGCDWTDVDEVEA